MLGFIKLWIFWNFFFLQLLRWSPSPSMSEMDQWSWLCIQRHPSTTTSGTVWWPSVTWKRLSFSWTRRTGRPGLLPRRDTHGSSCSASSTWVRRTPSLAHHPNNPRVQDRLVYTHLIAICTFNICFAKDGHSHNNYELLSAETKHSSTHHPRKCNWIQLLIKKLSVLSVLLLFFFNNAAALKCWQPPWERLIVSQVKDVPALLEITAFSLKPATAN